MLRSYRNHGADYYRILIRRTRRGKDMPSAQGTIVPGAGENVDSRDLLERICEMLTEYKQKEREHADQGA